MPNTVLLVVFDGLRPDMVRPDTTPNICRFAAMGTAFTRARSVFPSETRVCSATVTTGCLPRRHGLVANQFAHPADHGRRIDTGQMENLLGLQQDLGEALLGMPGLGERLALAAKDFVVLSSGSTGQSFVLNPRADALGQITISGHGPAACSKAGRAVIAGMEPPPTDPVARAVWIAELFRTEFLPNPPAVSVVWLCEPDTSAHFAGLGAPAQIAALRLVDAAFGRILDAWQAGPQRDWLQIIVASDHGHATISGLHNAARAIADVPAFKGATLVPGTSGSIWVPDGNLAQVSDLAEWLMRQDWTGCVFAAEGAIPPGALPIGALLADHRRGAPLIYTLRSDAGPAPSGLPGTTLYDGNLAIGAGTHGGLSAAELHTVLMLAGSRILPGGVSEWPAGLADIAPTILALLDIPGEAEMDGRCLSEAIIGAHGPAIAPAVESWEGAEAGYAQRLARTRLGAQVYLDVGMRE
jgi:arylsulfatase A-like enzyme